MRLTNLIVHLGKVLGEDDCLIKIQKYFSGQNKMFVGLVSNIVAILFFLWSEKNATLNVS